MPHIKLIRCHDTEARLNYWPLTETSLGVFNYSNPAQDAWMAYYGTAQNWDINLSIWHTPAFYQHGSPLASADLTALDVATRCNAFVTSVLNRYPGKIRRVGFWNEPSPASGDGTAGWGWVGATYAARVQLLADSIKEVYNTVKGIDNTIQVTAGDFTYGSINLIGDLLGQACTSGGTCRDFVDIVTVHQYNYNGYMIVSQCQNLVSNLARGGAGGKPFALSEHGQDVLNGTTIIDLQRGMCAGAAMGAEYFIYYSYEGGTKGLNQSSYAYATIYDNVAAALQGKTFIKAEILSSSKVKFTFDDLTTYTSA
jgi:hypothetical protein